MAARPSIPALCAPLLLICLAACGGPKPLETRVGPRRSTSLRATAEKVEGRWRVQLPLPAGTWGVETAEAQAFTLLPGAPKSILEWTVSPDRWAQQDRPFRFALISPSGMILEITVVYPDLLNSGQVFLLHLLCSGASSSSSQATTRLVPPR